MKISLADDDKNPIQTAVSLKYPPHADAPFITASSKGLLAQRMVEIAKENDIPVVRDKALANVLSVQKVGSCIPEETWLSVACIFAYIMRLERENGGASEHRQ